MVAQNLKVSLPRSKHLCEVLKVVIEEAHPVQLVRLFLDAEQSNSCISRDTMSNTSNRPFVAARCSSERPRVDPSNTSERQVSHCLKDQGRSENRAKAVNLTIQDLTGRK